MSDLLNTGGIVIDTSVNTDNVPVFPPIQDNLDLGNNKATPVYDVLWERNTVSNIGILSPKIVTDKVAIGSHVTVYDEMLYVAGKIYSTGGYMLASNIHITMDGNGEMVFTDALVVKTLSQLSGSYPAAGIVLSTGSAWGTSITDNSANWNTAYGWGNHAGLYEPLISKSTGYLRYTGAVWEFKNETYSLSSHAHGNITNAGYLGSTANIPLITGTAGIIVAGAFGTGAATFCEGNDSRLSDSRTPTAHQLDGALHTVSGLTPGHFMKALTANTFGFAAHGLIYSDVGAQQVHANLTSLAGLSYSSASFVKMTGTNTFTLDTNTYALASHSHAESEITFTDITTNNSSVTKHGYLPKLAGGTSSYLRADGSWATPSGGDTTNVTWVLAIGTDATVGTNKTNVIVVPRSGTIVKVFAYCKTAPVGAALIFDINIGGTSIWSSTPANRIQIAAGAYSGTQTSFDTTSLAEGDLLTIDIDQIGSSTAGKDITIILKFS